MIKLLIDALKYTVVGIVMILCAELFWFVVFNAPMWLDKLFVVHESKISMTTP